MSRRGFGLLAMLAFCSFLGICLCVSAYYCYQLENGKSFQFMGTSYSKEIPYPMVNNYSAVDYTVNLSEYYDLENQLKKGAVSYIKNVQMVEEGKMIITAHTLKKKNIIDSLYDSKGNICNGYVVYDSTTYQYFPYIRCGVYQTIDYVNRLE